jgi:O-antigen/teichoic acid export membrane protein
MMENLRGYLLLNSSRMEGSLVSAIQRAVNSLRRLISLLKLRPFDTSTSEGLSNERYRRAALTAMTSVIAKSVSVLTGFVTVPLTLNYLGTDRYGLWMTISSITVMMAIADFGLGNGLVNAISQSNGERNPETAKMAVSSTFLILFGFAVLLSSLFWWIYPAVDWSAIFNVRSEIARQESGPTVAVFFFCLVFNIPLGIVQRIQLGYQEGYLNNLWQIMGNVCALLALISIIQYRAGLPWLMFALSGVPTIVLGGNWLYHFFIKRPWLLPRFSYFNWAVGKSLFGTGAVFMLLAVVNILGTSADNIIIARFAGSSEVAKYAVLQRLFSILFIVQMLAAPMWPAFGEALVRKDLLWIRTAFKKMQGLVTALTLVICIILFLIGAKFISIWAGPEVVPSVILLAAYASYRLITSSNEAVVALLSVRQLVRSQLYIALAAGVVTFGLKVAMASRWEIVGVALAGTIGYGLFYSIPAYFVISRLLKGDHHSFRGMTA